ncbi:MAG: hypothetical protein V2J14_05220 [Erythrobacter sp.]|nr:hypothetical protein [Erythrobacter sp.]
MTSSVSPDRRGSNGWQLILADLALLLFLVSASVLTTQERTEQEQSAQERTARREQEGEAQAPGGEGIALAVYRSGPDLPPGSPGLDQWLALQQPDPRATLTITATHAAGDETRAWREARSLAQSAQAQGVRVRVMIRAGKTTGIAASLTYDEPAG